LAQQRQQTMERKTQLLAEQIRLNSPAQHGMVLVRPTSERTPKMPALGPTPIARRSSSAQWPTRSMWAPIGNYACMRRWNGYQGRHHPARRQTRRSVGADVELLRGRAVALRYLSDLPGAPAGFRSGRGL
jgi:hypothetical protein